MARLTCANLPLAGRAPFRLNDVLDVSGNFRRRSTNSLPSRLDRNQASLGVRFFQDCLPDVQSLDKRRAQSPHTIPLCVSLAITLAVVLFLRKPAKSLRIVEE